ncbi:Kazrin [Manis pentadactyla]|nr:Kazrin [Manis pentadactyla]
MAKHHKVNDTLYFYVNIWLGLRLPQNIQASSLTFPPRLCCLKNLTMCFAVHGTLLTLGIVLLINRMPQLTTIKKKNNHLHTQPGNPLVGNNSSIRTWIRFEISKPN